MDARAFSRALVERHTRHPSLTGSSTSSDNNITPFPIRLIHENAPRRPRSTVSTDNKPLNDDFYRFWDRFLATSPSRILNTSARTRRLEKTLKAASGEENGLHAQESSAASYEQAAKECKAKVDAVAEECIRLNQKYRDRTFEVEQSQTNCIVPLIDIHSVAHEIEPSGVKRVQDIFEKPVFNVEGSCGDDVMQGSLGDCWFIAALSSVSAKPGLLQRLCIARNEAVGVYGFVFFRDGEWVPEVIDDRLFIHVSDGDDVFVGKWVGEEKRTMSTFNNCNDTSKFRESLQKGGEALYFARCRDSQDTWLPLIEKAFAKAHGDYGSLHGGWVGEGTEDLTGGVSVNLVPSDVMDKSRLWQQLLQVNETYLFSGGAYHWKLAGNFGKHAYAVLQAVEHKELRLLKIRNPWGINKNTDDFDGPFKHKFEEWSAELVEQLKFDFKDPGVFWITLDNFLRHFESIQRTRLFNETWTLTQQWTCVSVPAGAVTYLDTSFQVTLPRPGPVVIVLAQPDVSYFQGLQGRYQYTLHFRVYNTKDTANYLARSMQVSGGNSINTRSVSVDLELEAGSYNILVKITPSRVANLTPELVIEQVALHRKKKLLQVGRNSELAHAKGKLREKEREARKQRKEQAKKEFRKRQAKVRRVRQKAKARQRKRKDRIAEEKQRREKLELLKRAGVSMDPVCLENTGYVGSDVALDAELEDDDFEWDSEMDGETITSESSEEEQDWYADDPWNALCVLGLRVYSQSSGVVIKVCEGDETDEMLEAVETPQEQTSKVENPVKEIENAPQEDTGEENKATEINGTTTPTSTTNGDKDDKNDKPGEDQINPKDAKNKCEISQVEVAEQDTKNKSPTDVANTTTTATNDTATLRPANQSKKQVLSKNEIQANTHQAVEADEGKGN